jgi:hypothetical protein
MFLCKHRNGFYYFYYEDATGKRKRVSTKTKLKSNANEFLSRFQQELKLKAERELIPFAISELRREMLKQ